MALSTPTIASQVKLGFDGRAKEKELAEKARQRRNTRQREQGKHHRQRQVGGAPAQTGIVLDLVRPGHVARTG